MRRTTGPREGSRAVVVTTLQTRTPIEALESHDLPLGSAKPALVVQEDEAATWSARMYREVGASWHWVDRLNWSTDQWRAWTDRDEHRLLLAYSDSQPCGYAELEQQADGAVEIAYFGLLPAFAGAGLGGWLLRNALAHAWHMPGTQRVWVHTCDLDAPAALANYRARGMEIVGRHVEWRSPSTDTVNP
jgi:ribosomal protein S18 acetylase RimI-like enzyme